MGAWDDGGMTQAFQSAGLKPPAKPAAIIVEVERGDTLSSIAKENKTTVQAILDANPKFTEQAKYKDGNMIWAGTTVKIPPKISTPSKTSGNVETPLKPATTSDTTTSGTTTSSTTTSDTTTSSTTETTETTDTGTGGWVSSTPYTPGDITTDSVAAGLPSAPPVKTAPIDTVLFDNDSVPIDTMFDLIFENIGGQELINISRSDTVNGQQVTYQPIKNLRLVEQLYNTNNLLSLQQTSDNFFKGFPIKLNDKIPDKGNGPNNSNVYIDPVTGNVVIETVNLNNDEQIEAQITISGTIYEIDFEELIS